jgi:5-amino-6-(5-phospho-D-ribitylamino)uracil phosphatase
LAKIYVTDLDGTLLNSSGRLSDYSCRELNRLIGDGANITVASARNLASMRQLLGEVPFTLPVIEINGSFVSEYSSGRHLCVNDIPREICAELCRLCEKNGCVPFLAAYDGKEDHLFYETTTNEGMEWFIADKSEDHCDRLKQRKITPEILAMNIVCFVIIGTMEVVSRINDVILGRFGSELDSYFFTNPYSPQWQWLTIHDKDARKSTGIKELLDITGHSYEELVVFGDNDNDLAMMQTNELGAVSVAVENALDHIKAAASEMCLSNDEDGVVRYICRDFYAARQPPETSGN